MELDPGDFAVWVRVKVGPMFSYQVRFAGDEDTACAPAIVSLSVFAYYSHVVGRGEYFRGVYVRSQPSLSPYNYVWVILSDGVLKFLFFGSDAAEVYV